MYMVYHDNIYIYIYTCIMINTTVVNDRAQTYYMIDDVSNLL